MEIFIFKKVVTFDENLKGVNSPGMKELSLSFDFHKKINGAQVDVSVILGENESSHHSLLLLRFWKTNKSPTAFSEKSLLAKISNKLKRGGLACRRTGGSSGLVDEVDGTTFFKIP